MASPRLLVLLFAVLCSSSIIAEARPGIHFHPCKTLILSYSVSTFNPQFETLEHSDFPRRNSLKFFAIYRQIQTLNNDYADRPLISENLLEVTPEHPEFPVFGNSGISSLRDRTKDILSVVTALLFGVGCGALTAGTMYLVWSLIMNRHDDSEREYEEDSSDGGDYEEISEKTCYVKIPSEEKEKKGYEGN